MLKQGSIIRAWVADPQGSNPKVRPLIIVTPTHEIASAQAIVAVVVTGVFSDPLAAEEVPLPYHPAREASGGLTKPARLIRTSATAEEEAGP